MHQRNAVNSTVLRRSITSVNLIYSADRHKKRIQPIMKHQRKPSIIERLHRQPSKKQQKHLRNAAPHLLYIIDNADALYSAELATARNSTEGEKARSL